MGYSVDELREIIIMIREYGYPLEEIAYKYIIDKNVGIVQGISSVAQLKKNLRQYYNAKNIPDEVVEEIRSKIKTTRHKNDRQMEDGKKIQADNRRKGVRIGKRNSR